MTLLARETLEKIRFHTAVAGKKSCYKHIVTHCVYIPTYICKSIDRANNVTSGAVFELKVSRRNYKYSWSRFKCVYRYRLAILFAVTMRIYNRALIALEWTRDTRVTARMIAPKSLARRAQLNASPYIATRKSIFRSWSNWTDGVLLYVFLKIYRDFLIDMGNGATYRYL